MTHTQKPRYHEYLELDRYPQPHVIMKDILINKLVTKSGLPKNSHFMDIGCGRGRILKMMADRGFHNGLGIDMQNTCIEICRERLKETGISVKNIGIDEIGDTFDLVIMSSVLEHIEDDQAYLHIVSSLINKGEYFLFTVPGDMRLYGKRDISYGHYRRYEKKELIDKLEAAGFHMVTLWSYGFNFLSKIYRIIIRRDLNVDSSVVTAESTGKSAIHSAGSQKIKKLYPFYSKLMFLYKIQLLFLNVDIFRANYAGLCQKL